MLTIPDELDKFYKTVSSGMTGMNSTLTDLTDKLTGLSNSSVSAKEGFSTYYNSKNKDTIVNKFTKIGELLTSIGTSVSGDLKSMLSKAQEIIDIVAEMDRLSKDEAAQQTTLSGELNKAEEDRNARTISASRAAIADDTSKFNQYKTDAENKLRDLKSMDANLDFVTQFSNTDYLAYLDQLQYGTFERTSYTASNGVTVDYYIYIPDYGGNEVEGLPVHLYLHGSGENGNGALNCGLPKLINDREITPSGIVICLQGHFDFNEAKYQEAVIELCDKVVEENNADHNKISLSGHSLGAITGYSLVHDNPNYFSAFIPISGCSNKSFKDVETDITVWAFHGAHDSSIGLAGGNGGIAAINNAGGHATMYVYPNEGHGGVQNYTFQRKFKYEDGEEYEPLEWAFLQSREEEAA